MDMKMKQAGGKMPISHEQIVKIMQWVPIAVSAIFFVKNIAEGSMTGMIVIGLCLALFIASTVVLKIRKMDIYAKELVLTVALPMLVFMISLFSGASYSDDFVLFLAVLGVTGMFLEPRFTFIQMIESALMLIFMFIIHPDKAESQSQYILCFVCYAVAALLYYQVIKRGRAYIELGQERAYEAEQLLESIRKMGVDLQQDFEASSYKIENGTKGLENGSDSIIQGAGEISDGCMEVRDKIKETENHIEEMNEQLKQFEEALLENQENVANMGEQIKIVGETVTETEAVLKIMTGDMKEIAGIAKQISDISYNLTILALNASVESGRAGRAGAGFTVVATNMRELSQKSDMFSEQVSEVAKQLLSRVELTSDKFTYSMDALEHSKMTMNSLNESFTKLTEQFVNLYSNIEVQNNNINQIDYIFDSLNEKVEDMHSSSLKNKGAVEDIVAAMDIYRDNINKVIEDTQNI